MDNKGNNPEKFVDLVAPLPHVSSKTTLEVDDIQLRQYGATLRQHNPGLFDGVVGAADDLLEHFRNDPTIQRRENGTFVLSELELKAIISLAAFAGSLATIHKLRQADDHINQLHKSTGLPKDHTRER